MHQAPLPESKSSPLRSTHHQKLTIFQPSFLDPSQVPALPQTLPQTGASTQPWQYLWCTPGTKTYTFFASYPLTPPPLDYINFAAALNASGNSYANQADIDVPDGSFTNDPAGTNVQVHMENAKGGKLTWGIANSALAGLWQFSSVYAVGSQRQNPIAFEVNDGQWGEIAIGYAGFLRPSDGTCLLQIYQGTEKDCSKLSDLID